MFRVSQEICLNTNGSSLLGQAIGESSDGNSPDNICIFGKYQRTPDADAYPTEPPQVYVSPELTDAGKVQVFHLPSGAVRINTTVSFVIKRNGVKGNFDVRLESPSGQHEPALNQKQLDPERFQVQCHLSQAGLYKVHIKCNSVPLPKSPYIIVTIAGVYVEETACEIASKSSQLSDLLSNSSKVQSRGLGLTHINLLERNEFTVDGSTAGCNMLFVGILGPQGPCDEVVVKHLGRNVYRVMYQVRAPGNYILVVKWGDEHIPGSPFSLISE